MLTLRLTFTSKNTFHMLPLHYILLFSLILGRIRLSSASNNTKIPNSMASSNITKPTTALERFLHENALVDRPRGVLVITIISLGIAIGVLAFSLTMRSLRSKENNVQFSFRGYDCVGYTKRRFACRDWKVMKNSSDDNLGPPRRLIASTSVWEKSKLFILMRWTDFIVLL